mgnify:CR=1 FL=1
MIVVTELLCSHVHFFVEERQISNLDYLRNRRRKFADVSSLLISENRQVVPSPSFQNQVAEIVEHRRRMIQFLVEAEVRTIVLHHLECYWGQEVPLVFGNCH